MFAAIIIANMNATKTSTVLATLAKMFLSPSCINIFISSQYEMIGVMLAEVKKKCVDLDQKKLRGANKLEFKKLTILLIIKFDCSYDKRVDIN